MNSTLIVKWSPHHFPLIDSVFTSTKRLKSKKQSSCAPTQTKWGSIETHRKALTSGRRRTERDVIPIEKGWGAQSYGGWERAGVEILVKDGK